MEKIMKNSKLFTSLAVVGGLALGSQAYADTYLSIGSNPVGNTAYQWAAGISDVVNKNVSGVQAAAERGEVRGEDRQHVHVPHHGRGQSSGGRG